MSRKRQPQSPKEVFLSHSSQDRRFADKLAQALRTNHVPVWYSQTNLVPAQRWHDEIGRALARCDWFLLLLSPAAIRSTWVKRELFYALRATRYDERIVPILYRSCDPESLSWTLPDLQFVNFTSDFAAGCRTLLKTWGLVYRPNESSIL